MPKRKTSRMEENPLDVFTQTEPEEDEGKGRSWTLKVGQGKKLFKKGIRATFYLSEELLEQVRNAAYWTRTSGSEIVRRGIERELRILEEENGKPFPRREKDLVTGRPLPPEE